MSDPNDKAKEEVVVLAGGVRARMMAYQQEIQRKEKAAKKNKPVFKVADDLGVSFHDGEGAPLQDKLPVQEDVEMSISQVESEVDESHVFQRSMNMSGKVSFIVTEITEEELNEPEKPQEVKDEEEKVAKEKIHRLLGRDEEAEEKEDDAPVVMQAFTAVQRRYLRAIGKLRPEPLQIKKEEVKEEEEKAPDPEHKEFIRKKLSREMTKSAHLTELTSTWDDYYEKAQDKPTEEAEVKQVEEEIKQAEEKVNSEWSEFAEQVIEQVVEIVGEPNDDDSVKSEDSDMVKWREEARRLKAEAEERKKQKAAREERKKKRAQIAALRKKRAEEAAARKKAEEEAQKVDDAARLEAAAELEAARRLEEAAKKRAAEEEAKKAAEAAAKKKAEESDSDGSSSSDDSSSEPEPDKPKETKSAEQPTPAAARQAATVSPPPSPKKGKAKVEKAEKVESDSESSEDNKQTKKKSRKKKEKEKEVKEKDILDVKEKKEKKKDKKKKKKKGDDDLDDGWVEEYPRNFDGTLWKNPLKFWTNKPTKLNEVAPKVIMRPNPNSDVFCKSEDAINDNASFYWNKFQGDFNVLVKIKGSLKSSYDKAGIMVRQDERNWVMSGLEFFNQRINHSSCITRGISDWSLAPLPDEAKDGIWIAIKRHSNKVECFYSFDLKEWIQTRQGLFPTNQPLKVGIVCACPMGDPFKIVFERFRIQMVG